MKYDIMRLIEAHYVPAMREAYTGDFERDTLDALRELQELEGLMEEVKELREEVSHMRNVISSCVSELEEL